MVLNKTDLLQKFNNKQLIHLRKEIKRTGYVLAHHAEENVINYVEWFVVKNGIPTNHGHILPIREVLSPLILKNKPKIIKDLLLDNLD